MSAKFFQKIKSYSLWLAIFLLFVICLPLPANAFPFHGASSLTGLVKLKNMAKQSTPYDVAMQNSKPTLIEFYADWCTTCQGMAFSIHEVYTEHSDKMNLVMLNIDDPQWTSIVQKYKVTGVPKFVFLSADKEVLKSAIGSIPRPILQKDLQQIL